MAVFETGAVLNLYCELCGCEIFLPDEIGSYKTIPEWWYTDGAGRRHYCLKRHIQCWACADEFEQRLIDDLRAGVYDAEIACMRELQGR
jgi:hypothetical protein